MLLLLLLHSASSSIFKWLLGTFCEPAHWLYGLFMKCSITFGSISYQKLAFSSLALLSKAMIHRHTENKNDKGAHQPLIKEIIMLLSLHIGFRL